MGPGNTGPPAFHAYRAPEAPHKANGAHKTAPTTRGMFNFPGGPQMAEAAPRNIENGAGVLAGVARGVKAPRNHAGIDAGGLTVSLARLHPANGSRLGLHGGSVAALHFGEAARR